MTYDETGIFTEAVAKTLERATQMILRQNV